MKRIVVFVFALTLCISSFAQSSKRQQMIHMAAVRIADRIELNDDDKETFINLYQRYKKECADIMKVSPMPAEGAEDIAEAKILCDFEKSEKILSLRKSYYSKFRTILSPSQIQKMYNAERAAFAK